MFTFFISANCTEPNEIFRALDMSQIIPLLFDRIIFVIFDMFICCWSWQMTWVLFVFSGFSTTTEIFKPLVYRLITHSNISLHPDKHFKSVCSCLAQFKTKFHIHSLFDFIALHILRQRCKAPIQCTLSSHLQGERSKI